MSERPFNCGSIESENYIDRQYNYSSEKGNYGPLGSIAANGCGSIALHNLLLRLGYESDYESVLVMINRDWKHSLFLGGLLGTKATYIIGYLKKNYSLKITKYRLNCFQNLNKSLLNTARKHRAYINLYFTLTRGHYTMSYYDKGRLLVYNEESRTYQDHALYFKSIGAIYMIVYAID